jgi:hypothetical protein
VRVLQEILGNFFAKCEPRHTPQPNPPSPLPQVGVWVAHHGGYRRPPGRGDLGEKLKLKIHQPTQDRVRPNPRSGYCWAELWLYAGPAFAGYVNCNNLTRRPADMQSYLTCGKHADREDLARALCRQLVADWEIRGIRPGMTDMKERSW